MKKFLFFIIVALLCVGLDCLLGSPTNALVFQCNPGLMLGLMSAVGSLLGDIFGGLFSANAQEEANQTNLQIARETNANQYKMWQEQLGWNREYLANQQVYNTPTAQRSRFQQAGINPYAMLGQLSNGNIDLQTAPQAPQLQRAEVQPVNYQSGISNALHNSFNAYNGLVQSQKMVADTRAVDIDNQYRAQKNVLELEDKLKDILSKGVKTAYDRANLKFIRNEIRKQKIDLKYYDEVQKAHSDTAIESARKEKEMADEAHYKAVYQQQMSDAFPQMNKATLNEISSRISANHASAAASHASAGYSNELSKTEKKNRKIKDLQIIAEGLRNDILRGEKYIQSLGIPAKELEAIKNGQYLQYYKNHPTATWLENQWQHFWNDLVPSLPVKFR